MKERLCNDGRGKQGKKDRGKWFREMRSELKKVVWPDGKTTAKNTGTVLLCSLGSGRRASGSLTQWPLLAREDPHRRCSPAEGAQHG